MDSSSLYLLAADAVLLLHVSLVAFIIFGLVSIYIGGVLSWSWIRSPLFRCAHLLAIGVVAVQAWFGVVCPLTTIEMALRSRAGEATYGGTFISHWLQEILYYQAPNWVFAICYTAFGALVAISWFLIRPRPFQKKN